VEEGQSPLPPALNAALGGLPKSLVPATFKALDRLIGGVVDIPAAWLAQQKAKIDAQTEAYKAVETAIAKAAASEVGANPEIISRAVEVLVRKSYRQQQNREAVAKATVEELQSDANKPQGAPEEDTPPTPEPDEEWLNVFEQHAERASTERMQRLWGRVLAGEIRKPGQFSMRTLRFLAEFSQADALVFAELCENVFGDSAPAKLVKPDDDADISHLLFMEAAGLIGGASGLGLSLTLKLNDNGIATIRDGQLCLILRGEPNAKVQFGIVALTPMARELVRLLPERDARRSAKKFAEAIRTAEIKTAVIGALLPNNQILPFEVLWDDTQEQAEPAP
jgi:hypothetical protein